jgi:hypothetical protein
MVFVDLKRQPRAGLSGGPAANEAAAGSFLIVCDVIDALSASVAQFFHQKGIEPKKPNRTRNA